MVVSRIILQTAVMIAGASMLALILVLTEFTFIRKVSSLSLCIIGVVKVSGARSGTTKIRCARRVRGHVLPDVLTINTLVVLASPTLVD